MLPPPSFCTCQPGATMIETASSYSLEDDQSGNTVDASFNSRAAAICAPDSWTKFRNVCCAAAVQAASASAHCQCGSHWKVVMFTLSTSVSTSGLGELVFNKFVASVPATGPLAGTSWVGFTNCNMPWTSLSHQSERIDEWAKCALTTIHRTKHSRNMAFVFAKTKVRHGDFPEPKTDSLFLHSCGDFGGRVAFW